MLIVFCSRLARVVEFIAIDWLYSPPPPVHITITFNDMITIIVIISDMVVTFEIIQIAITFDSILSFSLLPLSSRLIV